MRTEWKLGPQRCRNAGVGDVELLAMDMGGSRPLLIRYRYKNESTWANNEVSHLREDGRRCSDVEFWFDIMPPQMTREEVVRECSLHMDSPIVDRDILKIIDCYDALIKSGQYVL